MDFCNERRSKILENDTDILNRNTYKKNIYDRKVGQSKIRNGTGTTWSEE